MCSAEYLPIRTLFFARLFSVPWPANWTAASPQGGKLLAVVGDDRETLILDSATGETVIRLNGHLDYSFAAAWHPQGHLVATGNQVSPFGCSLDGVLALFSCQGSVAFSFYTACQDGTLNAFSTADQARHSNVSLILRSCALCSYTTKYAHHLHKAVLVHKNLLNMQRFQEAAGEDTAGTHCYMALQILDPSNIAVYWAAFNS